MGSSEEDARRLTVVRKMLRDFEKRWKFTQRGCGSGCAAWLRRAVCGCMCGGETDEERLERIVRAKVLRTVHSILLYYTSLRCITLHIRPRCCALCTRWDGRSSPSSVQRPEPRTPPGLVARSLEEAMGCVVARECVPTCSRRVIAVWCSLLPSFTNLRSLFATRHRRLV